jgi:hypothetical protein
MTMSRGETVHFSSHAATQSEGTKEQLDEILNRYSRKGGLIAQGLF